MANVKLSLISAALLLTCSYAAADIVNGVVTAGSPPPIPLLPVATVAPPPSATSVNFDDISAPCIFVQTTGPLTSGYASRGITFNGPTSASGGVVLNECSSFSVTGYSSPNFLAFNTTAVGSLPNGGTPIGPETFTFSTPVEFVQVDVGSSGAGTITFACSAGSTLVGTSTTIGGSSLATLSIHAQNITRCTVAFSGTALVVDNVAFAVPIPILSHYMLGALSAVLALIAMARLARI
jgi:hypothetical protein